MKTGFALTNALRTCTTLPELALPATRLALLSGRQDVLVAPPNALTAEVFALSATILD